MFCCYSSVDASHVLCISPLLKTKNGQNFYAHFLLLLFWEFFFVVGFCFLKDLAIPYFILLNFPKQVLHGLSSVSDSFLSSAQGAFHYIWNITLQSVSENCFLFTQRSGEGSFTMDIRCQIQTAWSNTSCHHLVPWGEDAACAHPTQRLHLPLRSLNWPLSLFCTSLPPVNLCFIKFPVWILTPRFLGF